MNKVATVAIVYSKAQKVCRRVIRLDHANAKIDHFKPHKDILHKGEGWLEIPIEIYETLDAEGLGAYIANEIGDPADDRCCIVCPITGILGFVKADPAIDDHPLGEIKHINDIDPVLVKAKLAEIGNGA